MALEVRRDCTRARKSQRLIMAGSLMIEGDGSGDGTGKNLDGHNFKKQQSNVEFAEGKSAQIIL